MGDQRMRIGLCCGLGQLAMAQEAGYEYAEMAVTGVLIPEASEAEFAPNRAAVLASPIPVEAFNCFVPGHMKVTGPEVDLDRVQAYMEVAVRRVHECGARIVVFGSGGARSMPEGFSKPKARVQYLDAVRIAGDIGAQYGVTIVLEPLLAGACNVFNLVCEGAAFIDTLEHPHVKLLTDLFHFEAGGEPYSNIVAAGARFGHVHLATPAIPETGEGKAYDFAGFLTALQQAGYDGRISVEDNPGLLWKTGDNYPAAIAAVRAYVESFLQ
jgi:sugar phosphate isomerase/epimerase